jgi:SAM-dependent methyltransferase
MTHHSELINYIGKKINAKSYLEIGVYNRDHNFNKIDVEDKLCVDPDPNALADICTTSDEYFEKNPWRKFDLIFVDGLHHADQVKRDIINAWKALTEGGVIVVHDSNPYSEHITHVPRDNGEWTGDVYKTIGQISSLKFTVDFDYGCCVLRKVGDELEFNNEECAWDEFDMFRTERLTLVTVDRAKQIIDEWV